MKLVRIYVGHGFRAKEWALANLSGATITYGFGIWGGVAEKSAIIETTYTTARELEELLIHVGVRLAVTGEECAMIALGDKVRFVWHDGKVTK